MPKPKRSVHQIAIRPAPADPAVQDRLRSTLPSWVCTYSRRRTDVPIGVLVYDMIFEAQLDTTYWIPHRVQQAYPEFQSIEVRRSTSTYRDRATGDRGHVFGDVVLRRERGEAA